MSEITLNIREFNLSSIRDDATICFIGKRRSGKSFCMRELLYAKRNIPYGSVISGSEKINPFFSDFMPDTFVHHMEEDLDENIIRDIFKRQLLLKTKAKTDPRLKNVDKRFAIIFDDVLHDDNWKRYKSVKNIFMNGRHYELFFILAMQYPLGIPPALRANIDYTFIYQDTNYNNRKKLYENFAGVFPDFNIFCAAMNKLEKYECMIINTSSSTADISECVFWYKAKQTPEFKFGCDQYWMTSEEAKKKKTKGIDLSSYKKNKSKIRIKKTGRGGEKK